MRAGSRSGRGRRPGHSRGPGAASRTRPSDPGRRAGSAVVPLGAARTTIRFAPVVAVGPRMVTLLPTEAVEPPVIVDWLSAAVAVMPPPPAAFTLGSVLESWKTRFSETTRTAPGT